MFPSSALRRASVAGVGIFSGPGISGIMAAARPFTQPVRVTEEGLDHTPVSKPASLPLRHPPLGHGIARRTPMATFPTDGIATFLDTSVRAQVFARIPARPAAADARGVAHSRVASPWSLAGIAALVFTGPAIFVVQNLHSSASSASSASMAVTFLSLHSPVAIAAALLCPGAIGCAVIVLLTTMHVVRARPAAAQPPDPVRQRPEAVGTAIRTYTAVRMPSTPDPSRTAVWHWHRATRPRPGRAGADARQRGTRGPASARFPGR